MIGTIVMILSVKLSLSIVSKSRKRFSVLMEQSNQAMQFLAKKYSFFYQQNTNTWKIAGTYQGIKIAIAVSGNLDGDYSTTFSIHAPKGERFSTESLAHPPWVRSLNISSSTITTIPKTKIITSWNGESFRLITDPARLEEVMIALFKFAQERLMTDE